jgi:hypothetical protein
MADKKPHTTEIIVTEQKVIHSGNKNGRDYTIYQVIATNRNGQLIDLNLRSFDELPKNQVIKVEVEKYESEQYGVSYTVTLEGKKKSSGLGKVVDDLKARVKTLEERLAAVEQRMNGSAPPQASSVQAPPAAPSPGPPPVQQAVGGGIPDDNIPF